MNSKGSRQPAATRRVSDVILRKEIQRELCQQQHDDWLKIRAGWVKEVKRDKQIGGKKLNRTLGEIALAIEMFGKKFGKEKKQRLRDVFSATGAGDNPEVIRFIYDLIDRRTP